MSHQHETLDKDTKLDIEHIERKQTHDAASSFEDQPDIDPAFERKVMYVLSTSIALRERERSV